MTRGSTTEWIESAGGPLVLLPRSKLSGWAGVEGRDYDDACEVVEYAGILGRSWGHVIVLGDEPFRTAVVYRNEEQWIVRWMYAPDEQAAVALAMEFDPEEATPSERLNVDVIDEPYLLFDSAENGAEASGLKVHVPAKARSLETYVVKEGEVGLVIHRFESS